MDRELSNLREFQEQFGTEEACADYLFHAKWPDGFSCPRCGHRHAYKTGTRRLPLYECGQCRHQTSLTAGTILEGSRTDLRKWFVAFFLISRNESGISAVHLSKTINVTYKTAWLILRKIRHAMSQSDRDNLLSGLVRVGASVYGRPHNPSLNRHPQEHTFLIGSSVNDQAEPDYVKMKLLPLSCMRKKHILPIGTQDFAKLHVKPGTTDIHVVTGRFSPNRPSRLLSYAAKASQWINKTFHGLGRKHLQAYLDEFCYRQNLSFRNESTFFHLTRSCAKTSSVTYTALTKAM